jgi:hypothetical protein
MTAEQAWDSILTLAVADEYREMPADIRTAAIDLDLTKASAEEVLAAESEVPRSRWLNRENTRHPISTRVCC